MKYLLVVSLSFIIHHSLSCQVSSFNLGFSYRLKQPAGELNKRFGYLFSPNLEGSVLLKNNIEFIVSYSYLVGPFVKEDPIKNLRNSNGNLISQQRDEAIITLKMRGHMYNFLIAKNMPLHKNHRIYMQLGIVRLTHFIKFNNETSSTNQLLGAYAKGYDRLTGGFGIKQFIGYININDKKNYLIYAGISGIQAHTKSLRPIQFDIRSRLSKTRIDQLYGINLGIKIKIYNFDDYSETVY